MSIKKNSEDFKLLHRYLKGDNEAGRELYKPIFPKIERFVYTMTKNDANLNMQDKDDIIADIMVRAVEKQYTFDDSSSFSTFVNGIAKKVVLEARKKVKKHSLAVDPEYEIDNIENIDVYRNPVFVVLKKEEIEALCNALEKLTKDQREVIQLRLINGTAVKDIANYSGKSVAAIDSLYRRAITTLRKEFINLYGKPTDF